MPTDAIVTDAKAAAQYDADVESWGERGWNAIARICRWSVANGAHLPFDCPKPAQVPQ